MLQAGETAEGWQLSDLCTEAIRLNMQRERFVEIFEIALNYYNKTMTEAEWDFYYEELGGMSERDLDKAIRTHMASLKSFPQVSHLRPERKQQIMDGKKRKDPRRHSEFQRTSIACDRLFEARIDGNPDAGKDTDATYPINIEPVVDQAVRYYTEHAKQTYGDRTARSQCFSGMMQRLMKEFDGLPEN